MFIWPSICKVQTEKRDFTFESVSFSSLRFQSKVVPVLNYHAMNANPLLN